MLFGHCRARPLGHLHPEGRSACCLRGRIDPRSSNSLGPSRGVAVETEGSGSTVLAVKIEVGKTGAGGQPVKRRLVVGHEDVQVIGAGGGPRWVVWTLGAQGHRREGSSATTPGGVGGTSCRGRADSRLGAGADTLGRAMVEAARS